MNKVILTGVLLASALGCQGKTLIGGADGGNCRVTLPQAGFFGANVLYPGYDTFQSAAGLSGPSVNYELVARHDATETVRVTITLVSGNGIWYVGGSANDWRFSGFPDGSPAGPQTFETPNVTGEAEETIWFSDYGRAQLDVYACGAPVPVVSKVISWFIAGTDGPLPDASPPAGDAGSPDHGGDGASAP